MRFTQRAIQSCIVAGAAGDVLGGIAERRSRGLSDDTQLTLATCEAILEVGQPEPKAIADHMRAWFVAGESDLRSSRQAPDRPRQAMRDW